MNEGGGRVSQLTKQFDSHLYMDHYHARVHALLEKYPLKCPFCVETEIMFPGITFLIKHSLEKHGMVRKFYEEDLAKKVKPGIKVNKIVSGVPQFSIPKKIVLEAQPHN